MNFKKYFATIFCLLGIFTAGAYEKMSVATQAFLDNRSAFPTEAKRHAAISQVRGQEMVDVFITLHDSQNTCRITALGGVIGARFTGLVTAQVPVAKLQAIADGRREGLEAGTRKGTGTEAGGFGGRVDCQ
ncbi:MAG: hypothetical protein SPG08_09395, partial [Sodaliphilus sp.]|nr:hypothetical protein [Bacteroidales bacterium]MDY5569255.1 hypothetical protein [Sodaliphilus sp.]